MRWSSGADSASSGLEQGVSSSSSSTTGGEEGETTVQEVDDFNQLTIVCVDLWNS